MNLLQAIAAERAVLAARAALLDEIEQLAQRLEAGGLSSPDPADGEGEAAPAASPAGPRKALPARPKATGQGRDGLTPTQAAVLDAIRSANGEWLKVSEVADRAGMATARKHLQKLIDRGLVEAQGATSQRRYRAVTPENGMRERTTVGSHHVLSRPAKPQPNRDVLGARILGQLKHRKLNEPQLAGVLDVGREQVADACGKLLLADRIVMRPDGNYTLPLAEAA